MHGLEINHIQKLPLFPQWSMNFLENMLPKPGHIHLLQTRHIMCKYCRSMCLQGQWVNATVASQSPELNFRWRIFKFCTQVCACTSNLGWERWFAEILVLGVPSGSPKLFSPGCLSDWSWSLRHMQCRKSFRHWTTDTSAWYAVKLFRFFSLNQLIQGKVQCDG